MRPRNSLLRRFTGRIRALPDRVPYLPSDLLTDGFRLHREPGLEIYYAPFDYVNRAASLALVGITPGWTQMELAFRTARQALAQRKSLDDASTKAKQQASFAGAMRHNLVSMLDELGVQRALGLSSCRSLFADRTDLVHTTSTIRYPVFVDGRNYTGHRPALLQTPALRQYVSGPLADELRFTKDALIVPLGQCVSQAMELLIDQRVIERGRCLIGFPHPSGANGHRVRQFVAAKPALRRTVRAWFG
jgi:hypothetical protein